MQNTHNRNKPQWYLYIINNRLNQLYTGITTEPARRFREHQAQGPRCAKALRSKAPLTLCFCIELSDHSAALKAEIAVKRLSKGQKEAVIAGNSQLPFAHKVMNVDDVLV